MPNFRVLSLPAFSFSALSRSECPSLCCPQTAETSGANCAGAADPRLQKPRHGGGGDPNWLTFAIAQEVRRCCGLPSMYTRVSFAMCNSIPRPPEWRWGDPAAAPRKRGRNPCNSSAQAEAATAALTNAPQQQRLHPGRSAGRDGVRASGLDGGGGRASVQCRPGVATQTRELLWAAPTGSVQLRRSVLTQIQKHSEPGARQAGAPRGGLRLEEGGGGGPRRPELSAKGAGPRQGEPRRGPAVALLQSPPACGAGRRRRYMAPTGGAPPAPGPRLAR